MITALFGISYILGATYARRIRNANLVVSTPATQVIQSILTTPAGTRASSDSLIISENNKTSTASSLVGTSTLSFSSPVVSTLPQTLDTPETSDKISSSNGDDSTKLHAITAATQWSAPPSQAAFGPSNPSNRTRPAYKPPRENFLRARAKTWEKGTPLLTAPFPDEYKPFLKAPKRTLKSRAPFSLPVRLWPAPAHDPARDAVFALAVNYRLIDYVRFVGTLRRTGFEGDIVLAVSPTIDVRCKQCRQFLMAMDVIAYPVQFNCSKAGGRGSVKQSTECDWHTEQDISLPLAIIRHELYLSWAHLYSKESRLLILDFRDTFFQRDPFESLPLGRMRANPITGKNERYPFEQLMVLEHWPYKRMSNCPFNSWWVRGCWGAEKFKPMKTHPVLCSGSYFATRDGMIDIEAELLAEVREVRCHAKGVPSDQGYVNYLYWAGRLPFAAHEIRGEGIVNTVGALMAKNTGGSIGPLATWFKIISKDGFVLDNDLRTHSAVVHQWDRFYNELYWTVDSVLECQGCYTSKAGHPPLSCGCFKHGCSCK